MLKIRRPLGRLIFNMGIAIPGKTVFLIETAPWHLGIIRGMLLDRRSVCSNKDRSPRPSQIDRSRQPSKWRRKPWIIRLAFAETVPRTFTNMRREILMNPSPGNPNWQPFLATKPEYSRSIVSILLLNPLAYRQVEGNLEVVRNCFRVSWLLRTQATRQCCYRYACHITKYMYYGPFNMQRHSLEMSRDLVLLLHMLNFAEGTKHIFTIHAIPPDWHDTGSWHPFSSKKITYLFYIVSIMGAGVLATQGTRASAAIILAMLNQINSVPAR